MANSQPAEQPWDSIQHQFRLRQPIRPFVSSTFTDFHEEREHLVKYVFPQLNSLCHQRGTYFAPVDLRWGINEDQSHMANVVSLCLDYIQHCHPFFICLLGERYGTYRSTDEKPLPHMVDPEKDYAEFDWLGKNFLIAAAKGHDWLLQEAYHNCSITELEIVEAAFRNDSRFCRFYIRDARHIEAKFNSLPEKERSAKLQVYKAENEETEMLATNLKYRIANKGLHTQSFLTVGELGQKVLDDWVSIINQCYPPMMRLPDGITGEQFSQWALGESLAETRRRVFVPTPETIKLFNILDQHVTCVRPVGNTGSSYSAIVAKGVSVKASMGIVTLIGDRGCGKSAIVANWLKHFATKNSNIKVVAHYVGSSSFSTDIIQFMRRTIWELRGKPVEVSLDINKEDLSSFHEVSEAFLAAIEYTPSILVLDGLDELGGTLGFTKHQIKEMFWLPEVLPDHCRIITSTVTADLTYKALAQRKDNTFHVAPLFQDTADKASVLEKLLALHCKCLNKQHLEVIVNAKLSSKPLFLSIVANELKLFGTYAKVQECLEQYTSAANFRDLWRLVILRWTKDYGWKRNGRASFSTSSEFDGWVADTLRLIACSREGLTEQDILKLLKVIGYTAQAEVNTFQFALFRSATFDTLVERPGGFLKFYHEHLREAVMYFLLGIVPGLSSPAKRKVESSSSYSGVKVIYHEILANYFQDFPQSRRKAQELPYHYVQCENWTKLKEEITKPEMFMTMYGSNSTTVALTNDLLFYWRRLQEEEVDVIGSVLDMVNGSLYAGGDDGQSLTTEEWAKPGYFSDTDSLCSDLDSLASSDSRLESLVTAMRDVEVNESGRKKTSSQRAHGKEMKEDDNRRKDGGSHVEDGELEITEDTIKPMREFELKTSHQESTIKGRKEGSSNMDSGMVEITEDIIRPMRELELKSSHLETTDKEEKEGDSIVKGGVLEITEEIIRPMRELELKSSHQESTDKGSGGHDVKQRNTGRDESDGQMPHLSRMSHGSFLREEVVDNKHQECGLTGSISSNKIVTGDETRSDGIVKIDKVPSKSDEISLTSLENVDLLAVKVDDSSDQIRSDLSLDTVRLQKMRDEELELGQALVFPLVLVDETCLQETVIHGALSNTITKELRPLSSSKELTSNKLRLRGGEDSAGDDRVSSDNSIKGTAATGEREGECQLDSDDDVSMTSLSFEAVRSQSAVLAVHAGKFLAERSVFTQAANVLQLGLQEVIRYFPLNTKEQFLLTETQEALGNLSLYQLHKNSARSWYGRALDVISKMSLTPADSEYKEMLEIQGRILNQLGNMSAYDRRIEESERYLGKAKRCMEECNNIAGQATTQYNLGLLRARTGNFVDAEHHFRKALYTREHWYGKSHPGVAEVLNNLAGLLCEPLNKDSYDRIVAEALYQRALRIRKTVYGDDHLLVATTLFHLGKLLKRDQSLTCKNQAVKLLGKALDIRTNALGPAHRLTNAVRGTLKQLEQELNREARDRSKGPGYPARRSSATIHSNMSWHKEDLEVLDKRIEASRTKYLFDQKYGHQMHSRQLERPGTLGRERVKNKHLQVQRLRARSSSPALVRDRRGKGQGWQSGSPSPKRHVAQRVPHERSMTSEDSWTVQESKRRRPRTVSAMTNRHSVDPRTLPASAHTGASQVSRSSHRSSCNIPPAFDSNNSSTVHGPNSNLEDLLDDPTDFKPGSPKHINKNAWYHEPGRYPKDANDTYPPRRQQKRPNRFELPEGDDSK